MKLMTQIDAAPFPIRIKPMSVSIFVQIDFLASGPAVSNTRMNRLNTP